METNTHLLLDVINPTFLERMKQPRGSVLIQMWFSFNLSRNDRNFHVTIYSGNSGQVNISTVNQYGNSCNVILTDYCQNMDDFMGMLEKLDDISKRLPVIG